MKVADLSPASSPGEASFISTSKPRRSAQRRYIRSRISAQSWESVPPAPAWTVTTASPASYFPLNRRASSSPARRPSTAVSCASRSAAISSSSSAISARSARSSTSASSPRNISRRRCARAWAAEVRAAPSWSSQKPGRPISSSSPAASFSSPAGSKIVREQGQLLPDGGQARCGRFALSLGHMNRLLGVAGEGDTRPALQGLGSLILRDPRRDDPGGGGGVDAVGGLEVGDRGADLGGDLGADLVNPLAPETQDLPPPAARHPDLDRLAEIR